MARRRQHLGTTGPTACAHSGR